MNIQDDFAINLLNWFDRHGRHDLPWQHPASPYRVWVSEIMLQQTRVATVIPYFERFMERFPTVRSLADAELDAVLALWSGLGYYSRARNLHRAARKLVAKWKGELPSNLEDLQSLPGIGRSTAGAIAALGYGQCCAILDGNAKRVLCRYHAVPGWPGDNKVAARLWKLAEEHTPNRKVEDYTQAIMDLGATVCSRGHPRCGECPLRKGCRAYLHDRVADFPAPKPRKVLPHREVCFLMLTVEDRFVWLQKRPPSGVWGGLAGFPECPATDQLPDWLTAQPEWNETQPETWDCVHHTFTHFHLDITPLYVPLSQAPDALTDGFWHELGKPLTHGAPTPVTRLLARLKTARHPRRTFFMNQQVQCVKLGQLAEGLDRQPYPGELGKRVYENVSKEGWQMWLKQQTILINEYRLSPMDPKHRQMLEEQMEQFFFGTGAEMPEQFKPQ